MLGDYDNCITNTQHALADLRPVEPIEYLATGIATAIWATYITGRWSETPALLQALGEAWERLQNRAGATRVLTGGYVAALLIAIAQEDRPTIDAIASVLERILAEDDGVKNFIAALREDDMSKLDPGAFSEGDLHGLFLMLFSERDMRAPDTLLSASLFRDNLTPYRLHIAQALAAGDNAALVSAIDRAEAHHLIVHAARMRIVLAQRTGDRRQLERARCVLEPLHDKHFLRRLAEVEALLS